MTESSQAHETWEELAAGYALHALGADDERQFLDHLTGCPRCASALDDYELVGAQLGALAETETDELPSWNRIRGAIVEESPAEVVTLDQRRRTRSTRILAAAAAVVTVTAVGVAGWEATHGGGPASTPATTALTACHQQVGCRTIRLHAPDGKSPAAVIVNGDRAAVVSTSLTSPPARRTYVLWQMPRDGGPIPISEFRLTGRQTAFAPLSSPYADTTAFAISLEAADVTPSQPTQVLAIGTTT
ncbi:MAG TPA: anti-sigma factor [Mycobacteriales bacterium]|jgi:anti-sigma-K factor RskA|nr:anti-sigma factor [Mycobacteriales bacterium]